MKPPNLYESADYLHQYLLFHYGRPAELCPFPILEPEQLRFHERLRKEFLLPVRRRRGSRALDVGCAVGRLTFELGRAVEQVLGIDNSKTFIRSARRMARHHRLTFPLKQSGDEFAPCTVLLPRVLQRLRVRFELGDALDLTEFPDQAFQVISAVNLIDRLPHPQQFLLELPRLLAPDGQLILASPLTWMEDYTPCSKWLTSQQILELLQPSFQLERHGDLPFLIREHRRKYQLVISEVWTFRRSAKQ